MAEDLIQIETVSPLPEAPTPVLEEVSTPLVPESHLAQRFAAIGGLLQAVEERLFRVSPQEVAAWDEDEITTSSDEIAEYLHTKGSQSDKHIVEGAAELLHQAIAQERRIQATWESKGMDDKQKAQQEAGFWMEQAFAKIHPSIEEPLLDEKAQAQIRVERVLGGVAISNIPSDVFAAIAVRGMEQNGKRVEDRTKVIEALESMPGVAITVPIAEFLPEDQVPQDIKNSYVVLVKEGPEQSMEAALRHEVQGEITGALVHNAQKDMRALARYASMFGGETTEEIRTPLAKAMSDLAARTAEGDVDITVASLGISPAFAHDHRTEMEILDRLVQLSRERVVTSEEEDRKAFARLVLGGMIHPRNLLAFLDPENTTIARDTADIFQKTMTLTSPFAEGRFIYTKASLKVGQELRGEATTYKILGSLSSGGYGTTYVAEDEQSGKNVVIKEAIFSQARHGLINQLTHPSSAARLLSDIQRSMPVGYRSEDLARALHKELGDRLFSIFTDVFNSCNNKQGIGLTKEARIDEQHVVLQRAMSGDAMLGAFFRAMDKISQNRQLHDMQCTVGKVAVSIQNEYEAGSLLRGGPGIPQVYELIAHENVANFHDDAFETLYFVEQFIPGKTIYNLIPRITSLNQVLNIILPALSTLDFAHKHHVMHHDVKPANLMQDINGEVWFIDWGLAKGHRLFNDHNAATPGYAPPNSQESLPATDIYAMGAMMFELITKQLPYLNPDTLDPRLLQRMSNYQIISKLDQHGVSVSIANVIAKALDLDPKSRFSTAKQMQDALRKAMQKESASADVLDSVTQRNAQYIYNYMQPYQLQQRIRKGDTPEKVMMTLHALAQSTTLDTSSAFSQIKPLAPLDACKFVVGQVGEMYGIRKFDLFTQWWDSLQSVSDEKKMRAKNVQQTLPQNIYAYFNTMYLHIRRHPSDMRYLLPHINRILQSIGSRQIDTMKGAFVTNFLGAVVNLPEVRLSRNDVENILGLWENALLHTTNPAQFIDAYTAFADYHYAGARVNALVHHLKKVHITGGAQNFFTRKG